ILHRLHLDNRARLVDLLDGDVAQTDMTALALPLQLSERLDALLERHARIRRMKLIQPDLIDSERSEAPLARFADVLRRAVARPLAARPPQTSFRSDADLISIRAIANRRCNQPLVVPEVPVIEAVDVGGVDERHS